MANKQAKRWKNWSGSVRATPRETLTPQNIEELAELISSYGKTGRHMRVVGAGHSFTPLVQTDDVLISLDRVQGIEQVDEEQGIVTVLAGTRLKQLGQALFIRKLAQENLGDIDEQSIAGAISTGTHGTGIDFGSLATQIVSFTLVTATGELLECSEDQNADIFKAGQVSLGMLGIIARVKLRVVPAFKLHYHSHRGNLKECLNNLERHKQENDHFEFYWFPYTELVQLKFLNETNRSVGGGNLWGDFSKTVLENGVFGLLSELSRIFPRSAQAVSQISAQNIPSVDDVNFSYRVFPTPRAVRFQEMEYNIPAEHLGAVLAEMKDCIKKNNFAVHFPIECRFVHSDDIWLSPAYQRESAYMAVHMYRGMPYKSYFAAIEEIFQRYQGRPHWGKMHTLKKERLAELYPRWHDFCEVRKSLDPEGMFLNEYLRGLFGE
jgi:FAD-linked oxidoreductase